MVGHLIERPGPVGDGLPAVDPRRSAPTTNLHTPDPECDLDYVPLTARRAEVRTAAANAFGFGGQNCVVVMRAPDQG